MGLDNFIKIFTDDRIFRLSIVNSIQWVIFEVVVQLIIGLILALILNQVFFGRTVFRIIAFVPWAISGVLTSIIWSFMYNEHMGVVNDLLLRTDIIGKKIAWLSNANTVFLSTAIAELWRGIPFFTIMLLAALQTIPKDVYESSQVDGANRWQTFWFITIPFLKEQIVLSSLLRAVWEFNNVDVILNLTGGGPAHKTTTLTMYIVEKAMGASDYGYASALAVVSFLFLLIFAIIYLKLNKTGGEET